MDACLEKCACRGSYLDKFLQPAILVVLQRGSSHGFQMISDLEKSGMVSGNGLDPAGLYRTLKRMETAGLYRTLKRMETAGLVTSYWDTESASKPRRVYSITDEGRHCLSAWEKTLLEYRSNIDAILRGILSAVEL